jgi:hypothetical protein
MPRRIKSQLPFTKKQKDTASSKQVQLSPAITPSWKLYHSIHNLPLSRFIDLVVKDYKGAVIIEGNPPEHEINLAIEEIRQQYADAIGDAEYKHYLILFRQIAEIELTLSEIYSFVETMRSVYHPLLAKALNSLLKTNFEFDVTKKDEYDKLLDRCLRRSNGFKIDRDLKLLRYRSIEEKLKKDNHKPSEEYFTEMLITLSDHAKFHLTPDNITVGEFCNRIQKLNKMLDGHNLKKKK